MGRRVEYKAVKTEERMRGISYSLSEKEMVGYKLKKKKLYTSYVITALTFGFLQLIFHWRPDWKVKLTHSTCDLKYADYVLIIDAYKQTFVEMVHIDLYLCDVKSSLSLTTRYFMHKKIKHIWSDDLQTFTELRDLKDFVTCEQLHILAKEGRGNEKRRQLQHLFGPNFIKVPVRPVISLIFNEAITPFYLFQIYSVVIWAWQGLYLYTTGILLAAAVSIAANVFEIKKAMNPFYVFQLYSSILWYVQEYWMYTTLVLVMSIVSVGVTVWETRRQSKALRNTVKSTGYINVRRENGDWGNIPTEDLVPGDVVEVPHDGVFLCDAALLTGTAVLNESMLTGESVPVTKISVPTSKDLYSPESHKRHTIFCGTQVLQTHSNQRDGKVEALVIRTGFNTSKGELVRSILFPKPVDLKFYSDGMKFMGVSGCIGVVAGVYTIVAYALNKTPIGELVISALDIITFVVPPSLPATMTLGNLYAQRRLKKDGIFCLSSKYINICGTLNLFCFDKTGTLTEDSLDLYGVVPVSHNRLERPVTRLDVLGLSSITAAMATCHSLIHLEGELTGDPLDLILFQSLGWELLDPKQYDWSSSLPPTHIIRPAFTSGEYDIYMVHQFPFSSALQRMSVIVECGGSTDDNCLKINVKGAPEKIASLCKDTTIPEDFQSVLNSYTSKGYRVIALANKRLPDGMSWTEARDMPREDAEKDLNFLGFAILQNSLKKETAPVLEKLHKADIRTVMVTGDNLETAIHTSRSCGMVAPLDDVIIVKAEEDERRAAPASRLRVTYRLSDDVSHNVMDESATSDYLREGKLVRSRYHFACDGKTFGLIRSHDEELFEKLVQRGTVFARMLPEQKGHLVEQFQDLGHTVGMCGDGANDCGALKTANSGVSLSTAEASVASPFTSKQQNIQCVFTLIREGRCALVSSFALFKHLLACSWIFCVGVLILYSFSCDMFDSQYIFMDGPLIIYPTFFFGNMRPYEELVKRPPPQYLADFSAIFSMIGYIIIQMSVIMGALFYTQKQIWYLPWEYHVNGDNFSGYENTVIFLTMCFSFSFSSIVFCRGPPYRKPIYTNLVFLISMIVIMSCVILINVVSLPFVEHIFGLMYAPTLKFHHIIVGICVADLFISLMFEDVFINEFLHKRFLPWLKKKRGPKTKYERLEYSLARDPDWPPLDTIPRRKNSATKSPYPFSNLFLGIL